MLELKLNPLYTKSEIYDSAHTCKPEVEGFTTTEPDSLARRAIIERDTANL